MKFPDSLYRDADRRWFTQGVSFSTGLQTGKWRLKIKFGFGRQTYSIFVSAPLAAIAGARAAAPAEPSQLYLRLHRNKRVDVYSVVLHSQVRKQVCRGV